MRRSQENAKVRNPTVMRALHELYVPAILMVMARSVETGYPDTGFLIPGGRPLFIEFKWGEKTPDPKQEYWHKIFRDLGYDVEVHNNVDEALTAIAFKVVAAALHAAGGKVFARAWRGNLDAGPRITKNEHYTRSIQFLKEKGYSETAACYSAAQSCSSGLAR